MGATLRGSRSIWWARWLVASLLLALGWQAAALPQQRLNVLFIAVDDLRPELGCYGNRQINTPAIDALAAAGVRFDRAYVQFPLCNPSRTSLLTGRHPGTTGVTDNRAYFRDAHPDWVTLPQHFKAQGYVTARAGKIFHGGIDDAPSWTIGAEPRVDPKTRKGQDPMLSDRIVKLEGDGQSHVDYRTATRAIELLEQLKDRPFFLAVGFTKPHSPPTAPAKLFDLYDPAKIPLPPDFAPRPTLPPGFPAAALPMRNGDLFIGRDASPEAAREMIQAYWAATTFVDRQVARVLEALDRLNLREKTLIVFFGDHGYHLGEKGKWSKHNSVFEVACRVPFLIAGPGISKGGVSPRTVQLVDLYPTLCEACGLPLLGGLEGHSLVPLLKEPAGHWPHPAYTVCRNGPAVGHSVRTERWRYSEFTGGQDGAVLFDHDHDPQETKNLAQDPAHAEVVAQMRRLLADVPRIKP
jgi:arylsulfatase A-like enzyme